LRSAEIEGLVKCPFCDYAAICPPIEEDKEFRCENPECKASLPRSSRFCFALISGIGMDVTCRHCQRKSHLPLSCTEAMKDDKIAIRHVVEEAMTQALVRKCK
jgi:TRIAD3 protein (E3 ubiquitin-protein ligase RNF216)